VSGGRIPRERHGERRERVALLYCEKRKRG